MSTHDTAHTHLPGSGFILPLCGVCTDLIAAGAGDGVKEARA